MIRKTESFDNFSPEELGERIRKARTKQNLTLESVSEQFGMYHGQLSRIERGQFARVTPRVQKICTFLQIRPDDVDVEALCVRLRSTIRTAQAAKAMNAFLDAVEAAQNH